MRWQGRWTAKAALYAACFSALAWLEGCAANVPEEVESRSTPLYGPIDPRRSLAVTDQPILARFSLKRVLDQLVAQSGVGGLTSLKLFQQWWDIFNPKPGLGLGPHCDDQTDPALGPVLNGFPYTCRASPSEGAQASCNPFSDPESPCAYIPIGLFNRFELMPENGSFCGEYRIVYAKKTGITDTDDRNLVIFEAAMPNPIPLLGIEGCRPVVDFWANLSDVSDVEVRADRLEQLYFQGLLAVPPFPPVVHVNNFGDGTGGHGQIRTNQFSKSSPRAWSLRELKLHRTCGLLSCSSMRFLPVTSKDSPYGPLFSAASTHPKKAAFQAFFPGQVGALSGATIPDIDVDIPDTYNSGQSQASGGTETNYLANLTGEPSPLRSTIATALTNAGSSLTPDNIVSRAQALSCAGCHRISNNVDLGGGITWPPSLGFTHVTERQTEVVNGVTRFVLSNALNDVFLPHRQDVLEHYLSSSLLLKLLPLRPIGGFCVH